MYTNVLLLSSVVMTVINTPFIIISTNPFKWLIMSGYISSILNHGTNNHIVFRFFDRIIMVSGALLDLYYL